MSLYSHLIGPVWSAISNPEWNLLRSNKPQTCIKIGTPNYHDEGQSRAFLICIMQPASLYALVKSQSFFWGENFIYRQDIARTHTNINEQRNLWATGPWIFINKMALLLKAEFYFLATRWLNSQLHYVDALQRQVFHNHSLFLEFIEILITYRAILYFTYKFHVLTTRRKITNENLHIFLINFTLQTPLTTLTCPCWQEFMA